MKKLEWSDNMQYVTGLGLWGGCVLVLLTILGWAVMIIVATMLVRWAWFSL